MTIKDKAFKKGKVIKGKNPNMYRKNSCGNVICTSSYGKKGKRSREIDHKHPKSKGGSDNLKNFQPL